MANKYSPYYNPYEDVKRISELKGSYHTAKEKGQDPSPYANEAVQYYNNLRNNGKGDVADKLAGVDYTGSLEILKGYNAPTEYDWYDNLVGQKVEEASKPVRSETVDQIMSTYEKNNNLLNGQVSKDANGNYVSGAYADLYGQAARQMDTIMDMDFTQKPWYENLMAQYQLGGRNAAQGALASGASGNSGNIDSYAAANANRQQLAYTTAGTQAALDAYAQQLAAWQNAFGGAAGLLDSAAMRNNEALETGTKYYDTDSMERQNALNRAAELEKEKYQAQIDELMHNLDYESALHEADKTLEGNVRLAEAEEYSADKDYLAKVNSDTVKKQIADAELEAAKEAEAQAAEDELDTALTLQEVFDEIVKQMRAGNVTYGTWDEVEEFLIQNGYDAREVINKIKPYAERYQNPQVFVG